MVTEHGASTGAFDYLKPRLEEIYPIEGQITNDELFDLCCGENAVDCPRTLELEIKYPLLTKIFESVFENES